MRPVGQPRRAIEVLLDLSALAADMQQAWSIFVVFACRVSGVTATIGHFAGMPPADSSSNFAYLTGSEGLTRKLLQDCTRIYIQPSQAPMRIDGYFFCKWLVTKGSGAQITVGASLQPANRTVTLLSSVFQGDEYLDGFLENCAALQGYAECEHLLIRAASPGDEHARLVQHVRNHANAVYVNLAADPGLYAVWNLGVRLSTARYLSNANLDDRRAPEQLAYLQGVLNTMPAVEVASTALRISTQKNLHWENSENCPVWFADVGSQVYAADGLFTQGSGGLVSRNLPHCMPLWRRSLHARVGAFDETRYGPSADWAFWLQAGRQGALFHFSNTPLGLYLQNEDSYWRKDAATSRFDERIVAEFADLALVSTPATAGEGPILMSKTISEALSLLRSGACFEGLTQLLIAVAANEPFCESTQALLDNVALQFFGCPDFVSLASRHIHSAKVGQQINGAVFNVLVDVVHQFDPAGLGQQAVRTRQTLELVCIDFHECSGDMRGLLLLALLARRHEEFVVEQALLHWLHDEGTAQFWLLVQSVYRFTRPLRELCSELSDISPTIIPSLPLARHHVVYYPDYSKTNAYQELLYRPLRKAGACVHSNSDESEFLSVPLLPSAENVLHIHWVNRLFKPVDGETWPGVSHRAEAFLAGLAAQKQRGFLLYWTIHNSISHESADPVAEIAFRRALYHLADRIFVHHPMALDLLHWLPDHRKLCLCEHGNYDISTATSIERATARAALGMRHDDFVVAHLGQIRDYKGLAAYLPVLFKQIATSPRMKLVIAGHVNSPDVKRWLQENCHPQIIVRDGFMSQEELTYYMRAADLGFLTYSAVLTSGALFHWLTCGRPVLAPASGTIPAYVIDEWNGFIYRDEASLRCLLEHCVTLPVDEMARLSANAQTTAEQLDWGMWNF